MDERPVEIPQGFWERLCKEPRRLAAAVASLVLALGVVAIAAVALWPSSAPNTSAGGSSGGPKTPRTAEEPATETVDGTSSPSAGPTGSPGRPGPPGAGKTEQSAEPRPGNRPPKGSATVAYRIGRRVFVTDAEGKERVDLGVQPDGRLSLSPDGRILVIALRPGDPAFERGAFRFVDVAGRRPIASAGQGTGRAPVWAADSRSLLYASRSGIRRLDREGDGDRVVTTGADPSVSADGRFIARRVGRDTGAQTLEVYDTRTKRSIVAEEGGAAAYAWLPSGKLVVLGEEQSGRQPLAVFDPSARKREPVAQVDAGKSSATCTALLVSSDGKRAVLTESGDDGYSRMLVVSLDDGRVTSLRTRRDAYPVRWTEDGRILYFEGNVIQEESSRLASIEADGSGRRVLVEGARPW